MGGSLRNLAKIHKRKSDYPIDIRHGYRLSKLDLQGLADEFLQKDIKARELMSGLSLDRADIIAAAALVIAEITELSGADEVVISGQGVREGVFYEYLLAQQSEPILADVRNFSIQNLAHYYYNYPAHNEHVRFLALRLFDDIASKHQLGAWERDILAHAALIHDIGMAVNYYDHHQHGAYLVMSAALPGFSHREQAFIALLVKYHRKSTPSLGEFALLLKDDEQRLTKLVALLRLAEYLERSKAQIVQDVRCYVSEDYLEIEALARGEARVEIEEAQARSDLLASSYGLKVKIRLAKL